MTQETTTDEAMFKMRLKTFVPMIISVVVATNMTTGLIINQNQNTEQIAYNDEATKRRIKNAIKELEYKIEITDLKKQIENCDK